MLRDPVVLAKDYVLNGDEVGVTRPNDNQLAVGTSGCGKSLSMAFPTLARMKVSNPICSYAKESDAFVMGKYMEMSGGYRSGYLDIANPAKSTVSYDPACTLTSDDEIKTFSHSVVYGNLKNRVDDYWNAKAKDLLVSLTVAARFKHKRDFSYYHVIQLFREMVLTEEGSHVESPLDDLFRKLERAYGATYYAVSAYHAFIGLPSRTASCVRDTLAAAFSNAFPESVLTAMRSKPQFSVKDFCSGKNALFVITSATDESQGFFANLFYRSVIRQMLAYAAICPEGQLPRPVRLIFDDFACTAPIDGFEKDISLFRSAGMSALILLQSEKQLEAIYGVDKAAIIRQNCSSYVYFPGGFDDRTCDIVSKRMNLPYDEILYAPMGNVFVMQSGRKPVKVSRFDVINSREYAIYQAIGRNLRLEKASSYETA